MPHFPIKEGVISKEDQDREQRIRIKNRRKRFLDLHPEYFKQQSLELADPLLYDRLVRQFQSAAEREKEGQERGYSGVLEANLVRSEAKIDALQHPNPNSPLVYSRAPDGSLTAVEQDDSERAQGRDDGWEKWMEVMGLRFIKGDDHDFDYAAVDDNDDYDDRADEDQTQLEKYLDDEEAVFVGDGAPVGQTGIQDF